MGLSVSNGAAWWGRQTFQTHVVYLNMELSKPYFEQRLVEVAETRNLSIPHTFHVIHLRGAKLHELMRWEAFLKYLESLLDRFPQPLVISDPIYKMLGGRSENSAGDINVMMDQLEDLIQRTQGANAFGHHFTKGNQSDKDAIDRASGSGVFQRDPDTLLAMTKHETDNCFTVESILRNHCPLADFVLEWHYPLFVPRRDLDPQDLKKPRGREPSPAQKSRESRPHFQKLNYRRMGNCTKIATRSPISPISPIGIYRTKSDKCFFTKVKKTGIYRTLAWSDIGLPICRTVIRCNAARIAASTNIERWRALTCVRSNPMVSRESVKLTNIRESAFRGRPAPFRLPP
jgi:hypothetical protein